ncbi:MAG TPA: AAA family ATPase, partial [Planctomycetota bacterium]|nr:AAA family ATPase [Planctomycetota bacterium]
MYEAHWNLSEKPFENDQNLKYFYESKNHKEALVRILYATEQAKPLAVIMGEHGSGKTFVCRSAAGELKKRGYRAGIFTAPSADPAELYRRASESLGLSQGENQGERPIETRFEFVRACKPNDPTETKRTVLFVDAIDSVNDERVFGEIRTLLDVTLDDGKPMFTIVLSGTPRSRDTLRRHPSLVQRIEVGYDLAPLGEEDARNYVLHRLRIAAGPKRIFDNAALRGAYKASSGLPRLLNRVCDLALLIGKIEGKDQILGETVDQAADEVRELGV